MAQKVRQAVDATAQSTVGRLEYPVNAIKPQDFNTLPKGKYIINLSSKSTWSDGRTAYKFITEKVVDTDVHVPCQGMVEAGHFAGSKVIEDETILERFTCNVTAKQSSFTIN